MHALRTLAKDHPVLSTVFALALLLTVFFGVRLTVSAVYWNDPARQDQPLAGWMTPRYVMRSWDVPPEIVSTALGIEQDGAGRRITLEDIARDRGKTVDELMATLEAAITAHRGAGR